jgi:two-component system, NtrC family, response regulator AtoC
MSDERSQQTTQITTSTSDGGYALVVVFPDGRWARFPLPAQGQAVVGRSHQASIALEHESISRRHVTFHVRDSGLCVEDLGSRNGTRVRGQPVMAGKRVEVSPGEIIDAGSLLLLVEGPRVGREVPPRGGAPASSGRGSPADSPEVLTGGLSQLHRLVERIAPTDVTVLLLGETGVGKERLAEAVVRYSQRAQAPFLKLNCAGLPEPLVESELFGHERGAFSGAVAAKKGLLEACSGGTLFLDEVGELPLTVQAKLLRAVEGREVLPVGATAPRAVDVRFIAATHRDLEQEVATGRFRQDLFYRLNGFPLHIPPLRERRDEIEPLVGAFIAEASERFGYASPPALTAAARAQIFGYEWPGNVRELRNVIERAVLLCADEAGERIIGPEHLSITRGVTAPLVAEVASSAPDPLEARGSQDDDQRRLLVETLERCAGNQTRAARELGIARNTLIARMEKYGLARPRKPRGS